MGNPSGHIGQPGRLGHIEGVEEHLFHFSEIAADEERLIDLEQQEVDGTAAGLADRTEAALPGVDTSVIKQADPDFDAEAFRAIARETFYKVREARKLQNPQESAELLSEEMQRQIQDAITGDVASHRHHLLPFLWIKDAVIAGAQVVSGKEEIDVRFSLSAAEEDLDDRTGQVVAGDGAEQSWDEVWRFTRTPGADTSASDERHEITFADSDRWMVAHRGWTVTDITRLPTG
jgi:predicted lipid-binding transport protein (Tim44 family)